MDVLNSSLISISKPYHQHHHILPLQLSNKQPRMQFYVSCRGTKNVPIIEEDGNNFYKVLCLSPKSATIDDIKRAYRTMALQYHPDVCNDRFKKEESTRMFVQLNAAYKILSNPKLKAEYDSELGLRRSRWMEQVVELNRLRRSQYTRKGEEGSWGSRMRAKNNINKDDGHNFN